MTTIRPSEPRSRALGPWTPARIARFGAVALTIVAGLIVLFAPLYGDVTETVTNAGAVIHHDHRRLASELGRGVIAVVGIPILLAVMPLLAGDRARRAISWIAAGLLTALCILAILSVGIFYLPAALALCVSAVLSGHTQSANEVERPTLIT